MCGSNPTVVRNPVGSSLRTTEIADTQDSLDIDESRSGELYHFYSLYRPNPGWRDVPYTGTFYVDASASEQRARYLPTS